MQNTQCIACKGFTASLCCAMLLHVRKIRNVPFIENPAAFVADNIGKFISSRNIANVMKAQREKQTIYIQVTCLPGSEETVAREFGNPKNLRDNYPKYVVLMEPVSSGLAEYPGSTIYISVNSLHWSCNFVIILLNFKIIFYSISSNP